MSRIFIMLVATLAAMVMVISTGCAPKAVARVDFSYVVDPVKQLPPGMRVISIEPAKVGQTTDAKWSELSVSIMKNLINESASEFSTDVVVTDRRDTQVTFDNADMQAAGMATPTGTPGAGGQLLGAQGTILSTINVKEEKYYGQDSTVDISGLFGGGGRGVGGGGVDLDTRQVRNVTRTLTVQTEFKLLDTANNRQWDYYAPDPYRVTDRTRTSPIFGSDSTEEDLPPTDRIIGGQVARGARAFVSRFMPCRIRVDTEIVSSGNKDCADGVGLLRARLYDLALGAFRRALAVDGRDAAAAYGAGLACEAMKQTSEALRYYRQAVANARDYNDPITQEYRFAMDRMETYGDRVRE